MRQDVALKFHSRRYGEELLAKCHVHGISFEGLTAWFNDRWIIVEPDTFDFSTIDIGKNRFVVNPSQSLDDLICGAIKGHALAMGKPLKEDECDILEGIVF